MAINQAEMPFICTPMKCLDFLIRFCNSYQLNNYVVRRKVAQWTNVRARTTAKGHEFEKYPKRIFHARFYEFILRLN